VVIVDVDDHPLSPDTLDAVMTTRAEQFHVVIVEARTTPGRVWLQARDVDVIHAGAGTGETELRLAGLRATDADVVAFVDARVVPDRGWLSAALARLDSDVGIAAVTGAIDGIGEPTLTFTGVVGASHPVNSRRVHDVLYPLPELAVVRRTALDGAGGLEPDLPWSSTVVDCAWRLRLGGARIVLDPAVTGTGFCTCTVDPYAGLVTI
jgi:hypothetical protein